MATSRVSWLLEGYAVVLSLLTSRGRWQFPQLLERARAPGCHESDASSMLVLHAWQVGATSTSTYISGLGSLESMSLLCSEF